LKTRLLNSPRVLRRSSSSTDLAKCILGVSAAQSKLPKLAFAFWCPLHWLRVSETLPTVTVIVPTRPGQEQIIAVNAARKWDYPAEKLEILIVRGTQPAVQRNAALKVARGEIIYFLDDDASALVANVRRAVEHFRDPRVKMVGGPNICPAEAPLLQKVFTVVLSSWVAFGPSRARYMPVGKVRPTSEKELILCNLLARREAVMELGGFDEALYPNEENALMDELQKRGGILLYDPELLVYRRPRPTLKAFAKMLLNYGRGRAEQFRLHPTPGSALNLAPPLFCLYLLLLPFLARFGRVVWLPLLAYALALLLQTIASAGKHGIGRALLALPLVAATHIVYGLGFWRGLFTRPKPRTPVAAEVKIERV
jgi:succinoglycan biosynthesis protein ExoA